MTDRRPISEQVRSLEEQERKEREEGEEGDEEEEESTEDEGEDQDESDYTYESDLVDYDPEKEWKNIVTQFNGLVFLVIIPVMGRMIGRRCAHRIWDTIAEHLFP